MGKPHAFKETWCTLVLINHVVENVSLRLCAPILIIVFKLYIYNKLGSRVYEDELCIGKSDIKYFYEETCRSEKKYWVVPAGEEPIRITEESYSMLKDVFFKES